MTEPRATLKGTSYLVTRRTTRRTYLFRPDQSRAMQNLFVYCLGVAAKKHGIVVHAVILMSTHYHLALTDTRGVLPKFLEDFHTWLARATKCMRGGWPEEVFNKSQTSAVALETPEAVVEEIGYLIGNPVPAGAVAYAREWPGLITLPGHIGRRVLRATRPNVYFDDENEAWPLVVELEIVLPAQVVASYGGADEARAAIRAATERHEREARDERRRLGLGYMGRARVLRVPFTTTATSKEEWGRRNPTFAAAGDRDAAAAAVARKRNFSADYRSALLRWRAGDRDVRFPRGTWKMRVLHGALVVPDG